MIQSLLIFAAGVTLGSFLGYKFRRPTTAIYGTYKNKVRGRNNVVDQKAEINSGMSRREVIKLWKKLRG